LFNSNSTCCLDGLIHMAYHRLSYHHCPHDATPLLWHCCHTTIAILSICLHPTITHPSHRRRCMHLLLASAFLCEHHPFRNLLHYLPYPLPHSVHSSASAYCFAMMGVYQLATYSFSSRVSLVGDATLFLISIS